MKNKRMLYIVLLIVAILAASLYTGVLSYNGQKAGQIIGGDNNGGNNGGGFWNPNPTTSTQGDQPVTKALKIVLIDALGGTGFPQATSGGCKIFDSTGKVLQEPALTESSGVITSVNTYVSGTNLQVRYYYDTTKDEYMWWGITVPSMSYADAQANTYNTIRVQGTGQPTLVDMFQASNGTSVGDAEQMDISSATTGTVTYSWTVSGDNTGFLSFTDPSYNPPLHEGIMVVAQLSGTNYDKVTLQGFDGVINSGSTRYYYKMMPTLGSNTINVPNNVIPSVSKLKQGNDYLLSGSGSQTFSYSAISYAGEATTLQMYVYSYADVTYFQNYLTAGPYAQTLAEQTITLVGA